MYWHFILSSVYAGFGLDRFFCISENITFFFFFRTWGSSTGKLRKYVSWRNMFINRPHVLFNGRFTWPSLFGIDRKNFF